MVLVRDRREREARTVRFTTESERTIWERATTRSARASVVKILRILLVQCSNFVQEIPQKHRSLESEHLKLSRLFMFTELGSKRLRLTHRIHLAGTHIETHEYDHQGNRTDGELVCGQK